MFRIFVISLVAAGVAAQVQVRLDQGVATGRVDNTPMGDVTKFLGLPYAGAPVGRNRFQPPSTHQGWGVSDYDASYFRANCPQKKEMLQHFYRLDQNQIDKMQFSEDCLYLNVFIPGRGLDENAALPVMIWFHGGDFKYSSGQIVGTSSKESPEALVISGNVIVVTFNYRLGALGFLTLGGKESSPNNALLDQLKAMAWVRKNIEKFGGNPHRITIFGDDMGAFSVQMHLYIEQSLPFFNRAAISSGAYTGNNIETLRRAAHRWLGFAEQLGCRSWKHNKTEVMTCLQEKSADELVSKLLESPPTVVIDGMLLKDQPENLLKKKRFNSVELIVGCNIWDSDFFLFGQPSARSVYERGLPKEMTESIMNRLLYVGYPKANTDIGRHLQEIFSALYFTNLTNPQQTLKDALHLWRDGVFWAPSVKLAFANMHAGKKTYVYFFEKSSPAADSRHAGSIVNGPGYGDEVAYIMGDVNANPGEEKHFMDSMMKAWSTFAHTGKPQFLDTANTPIDWPPFDVTTRRIGLRSPLTKESIVNFPPRGALYFNLLLRPLLELLEAKEKKKETPKPGIPWMSDPEREPEMGWPEKPNPEKGKPEYGMPENGKPEWGRPENSFPEFGRPENGKPEWGRPENSLPEFGRPENGKPESEMSKDAEPEERKHSVMAEGTMNIATYVMLAFICLLVLLMIIAFALICSMYNQMRNTPKSEKFQSI